MTELKPPEILHQIANEVKACTLCELHSSRLKPVPGYGKSDAEILFVGMMPDFFEDKEGMPIVGTAGLIFDELLEKANFHRKQVYVTNRIKCRPPNDREPEPVELEICDNYLNQQIATIQPKVVVTLGRKSLQRILPNANLADLHGKIMESSGQVYMPFYHPASVTNNPSIRSIMEEDFAKLTNWIDNKREEFAENDPILIKETNKPDQLSLF